jgi:hypothetical protein
MKAMDQLFADNVNDEHDVSGLKQQVQDLRAGNNAASDRIMELEGQLQSRDAQQCSKEDIAKLKKAIDDFEA